MLSVSTSVCSKQFVPKSILCVFLGYTEKHKEYWCLHPETGQVYISQHVLFDESMFPYSYIYQPSLSHANTPLLTAWYKGLKIRTEDEEQSIEVSHELLNIK